jgi:hypothetical protein
LEKVATKRKCDENFLKKIACLGALCLTDAYQTLFFPSRIAFFKTLYRLKDRNFNLNAKTSGQSNSFFTRKKFMAIENCILWR